MLDINNLPQVRTVDQLRSVMELVDGKAVPDQQLTWFVCIQNAESLSDMNLRECAHLFSDGIVAITTLEQVQEHIDTCFDGSEYDEESNRCLLAAVARYYGQHELAEQLLADKE